MLQRPRFPRGAPVLTARQAELYRLLPYRRPAGDAGRDREARRRDVERAVVRGVRFVEGVYEGRMADGKRVGPWTVKDGKFCTEREDPSIDGDAVGDAPICLAATEALTPRADDGAPVGLPGQDKFLGGVASPCGQYVVRVDVRSGEIDFIGPEYDGEFKWLRGVEVPGRDGDERGRIDVRAETTELIGPEYRGKAKWLSEQR